MPVSIRTLDELKGSDFLVIDAREENEFLKGHIPGAILLEWEDFVASAPVDAIRFQKRGWWGLLEDKERGSFSELLQRKGVDFSRELLVYGDGQTSKGREGRLAWMLLYLGAEKVSLLSGGWSYFFNRTKEVERGPATRTERVDLSIKIDPQRRCLLEEMMVHVDRRDTTIWDGRTEPEYSGEIHDYLPRKGHIPGAELHAFPSIFKGDSPSFLDRQDYLELLKKMPSRKPVLIAYCELGLRASTIALVHEAYTGEKVKIFDGGFMQWSLSQNCPVTRSIF